MRRVKIALFFSMTLQILVIIWCAAFVGRDLKIGNAPGVWSNIFFIALNGIFFRMNARNYRKIRTMERESDKWPH